MIDVAVHGAEGRMGQLVTKLIESSANLNLVALITEPDNAREVGDFHKSIALTGQNNMASVLKDKTVIVDFSTAKAFDNLLKYAGESNSPIVSGTTGLTTKQLTAAKEFSTTNPILISSNFSVGIPVVRNLVKRLAKILPNTFMPEIIETHHRHKIDKPSGTAISIKDDFIENNELSDLPIHSLRIGGVIGEHKIVFSSDEETLEISHRAHSRNAFLQGIEPAIDFVTQVDNGYYSMEDALSRI